MMKEVVGKGLLGQLGVGGILVVLVLQIVLPYVADSTPDQASHEVIIDRESMQHAVEPLLDDLESAVAKLIAKNEKQCDADVIAAQAQTKLVEVLTDLSTQQAITATAVATMQRQLERMHP